MRGSTRTSYAGCSPGYASPAHAGIDPPRPKPERRETGPAPASVAAGDVDLIEHPPHYTAHPSGIECIEMTEHMGFNLGAAITCLWQADLNGTEQDDLRNALWYISRELQKRERATTPAKDPQ